MKSLFTLQPVKWLPDVPLFDASGKGVVHFTRLALDRSKTASQLRLKVRRIEADRSVLFYDKLPFKPLQSKRQMGDVFVVLSLSEVEGAVAGLPFKHYDIPVADLDAIINLFLFKVADAVGTHLDRTVFSFNIVDVRTTLNV